VISNTWVDNLLGLYQHSSTGNFDNRGLASDFARKTYINTLLDDELLPAVLNGNFKAVFLTGNPGDGKTAFLEKVYDGLNANGCTENRKDASGWEAEYNGKVFTACYDASESCNGVSADERLKILFRQFAGDWEPNINKVVLVAINDGKLHSFFSDKQIKSEFKWLSQTVRSKAFSSGGSEGIKSIVIVNLKERTLVDLEFDITSSEGSLFDKLLNIFTAEEHWQICYTCSSQPYCPIFANAMSLGFGEMSKQARSRLKLLFAISHLRRNRHNTMRDIRSALSFIITGNLNCKSIHEKSFEEQPFFDIADHFYYNLIFTANDEALKEFTELDPSKVSIPQLDRQLAILYSYQFAFKMITRRLGGGDGSVLDNTLKELTTKPTKLAFECDLVSQDKIQQTNTLFPQSNVKKEIDTNEGNPEKWMTNFRRRLFFEGKEDMFEEKLKGVREAVKLLPYRHLELFIQHLNKKGYIEKLRESLCRGIAQMEGIRNSDISTKHLLIRVTQNAKEGLTICKKLPIEDFKVFTPRNQYSFMETITDKITFKHEPSDIQFIITLDLFEILIRMSEGQLPFSKEQKAVLDELADFKSRLHRYQSQDLLLLESNGQVHHITQHEGMIIRETVEENS